MTTGPEMSLNLTATQFVVASVLYDAPGVNVVYGPVDTHDQAKTLIKILGEMGVAEPLEVVPMYPVVLTAATGDATVADATESEV